MGKNQKTKNDRHNKQSEQIINTKPNVDNSKQHLDSEKKKYELTRESSLVTQAGLQTAVFSISTGALFTVWKTVLEYIKEIPPFWVHFAIGLVTFFLLLSLFFAVLALFLVIDTDKKIATLALLKENNNRRVRRMKISLWCFFIAIGVVFISVFIYVPVFYLPGHPWL